MEDCGIIVAYNEEIFPTGGFVIIDSGLYVLKGLLKLSKKGVFVCSVIKKRR